MQVKHQGHEHEFEADFGLPEPLPATEQMLWQGAPDWRMMARQVFHARTIAVYFGLLLAWQLVTSISDGGGVREVLIPLAWMSGLAAVCMGLLYTLAWLSARTTVYTLTNRRLIMRVGIVLTLTFNLPLSRIASAGLRLDKSGAAQGGTGDIPLVLHGPDHIAYLHLWPHVRPWRVARPEPMLRSVPGVEKVAALLATAWQAAQPDATQPHATQPDAAQPEAAQGAAGIAASPAHMPTPAATLRPMSRPVVGVMRADAGAR